PPQGLRATGSRGAPLAPRSVRSGGALFLALRYGSPEGGPRAFPVPSSRPLPRRGVPQAFGQRKDGERLAVGGRPDGDVAVELQVGPHARAVGDAADGALRVDLAHDVGERAEAGVAPACVAVALPPPLEQAVGETGGGGGFLVAVGVV